MKIYVGAIVVAIGALCGASANAQNKCGDPGGCSIASYAAFQNTVGIVQFGNTNGKVYLKKKRTLCNQSDCNQMFTMTAALAAPLSASSTGNVHATDLSIDQVLIGAQIREISSHQTELLGIRLDRFLNDHPAEDLASKAKLDSGIPDFKGAGDNGFVHIAPAAGNKVKFVHQILQPNDERLAQPAPLRTATNSLISGTVDRELSLVISVEVTDDLNVRLAIQPIAADRKKSGPVTNFNIPPTRSTSVNEKLPSASATPLLRDIPVLAHLFAHKRLRKDSNNNEELAIFIAPVLISNGLRGAQQQAVDLGPAIQLTKFQRSTNAGIEFFQTLAIDPQARFLVYSEFSKKCKKNILKFVRLDIPDLLASTAPAQLLAKPKVLVGCGDLKASTTGAYGIDVLNLN